MRQPCTNCNTTEAEGQWWYLGNYFGLHGYFCPECHNKVIHDPYGKPKYPEEYNAVLIAQTLRNTNEERQANPTATSYRG